MPGGGFKGNEIDVVITGDALIKKCPSVQNRIGEEGGPLASMPQMQVRAKPIFWRTLHYASLSPVKEACPPSEYCASTAGEGGSRVAEFSGP